GGRGGPGGRGPGGPVPIDFAVAELGTAARSVSATGTIQPIRAVGINSQLSGALTAVHVEEGTSVRAGAVLARLDSREAEAQLASAEASLELARRTAQRSEQLRAQQIVTAAEYDRDQAVLTAALATRDQLRTRLSFATVRAPIAGVITEKLVEAGDVVTTQTPLFTIADRSTLVVRVQISELDVTALNTGDVVEVLVDAHPDRTFRGQIRRIFPSADSESRLLPVEVALTGGDARILTIGFLARARFQLAPRENMLMIPATALMETVGQPAVYLLRGTTVTRRSVERGEVYQGRVEVRNGIELGDSVVVAGQNNLRDGATVRIVRQPAGDAVQPGISAQSSPQVTQ
ncbi:MAG TPA: efflux RND transporter periplasmic adaptor subunit, partial [Gemmatimonadaceae bacterium]|nr:efflux RND transporter periplasmic adaptor subunit [Gemmatimonadaceae bacterium]